MVKNKLYQIIFLLLLSDLMFAQTIDTKHLSLNLKFDWQKRQATGTAEITISVMSVTDKIYLDAGNLSVSSVSLNGKALKYIYDGGDSKNKIEIILDKIYQPTPVQ